MADDLDRDGAENQLKGTADEAKGRLRGAAGALTGDDKQELKGKAEQLKGKIKQATGDLTEDERLHDEGVADEASGNVQEGFGRGRRRVGEAIEDIGEKLKR